MKYITTNRCAWLVCALFCLFLSGLKVSAQPTKWRDHYPKTLVYEITNDQAEWIIKTRPSERLMRNLLSKPVTSFVDKWEDKPAKGHFIHVNIKENRVTYRYVPVMPFQVFLFNEYGVLSLQVIDSAGKVRDDAKIRIQKGWKLFNTRISFNKESQTYATDDQSGKSQRILTVELDGYRVSFNLHKHFVNPWYGSDGYFSSPDFYSYMLTDKNKYKPGETVRFKSYALNSWKKPIKSDLELWMWIPKHGYKKIKTVSPYNPGGFSGEFHLHDSLELRLDDTYNIQLRNARGRTVATTSFTYEDYELYDSNLEVKVSQSPHYYPNTNQIEIKATDANGLILQDVKADVLVERYRVNKSYADVVSIPDTIMFESISLDNANATFVDVPAGLFGKSDCEYIVNVEVLTFDGQRMVKRHNVDFYRSKYDIFYTTSNDTITFRFKELGVEKKVKATLSYNNSDQVKEVELPYSELFVQAIESYTIKVHDPKFSQNIAVSDISSKLDLEGGISGRTLNIKLVNPLNLDVSWYIYQGNKLISKGSGKELSFEHPNTDLEQTHYVEVFYVMGGKEGAYRRVFVPKTEFLSVELDMPNRIYPGQTLDAKVSVKDHMGHPVKNVDLTAFAVNSLLKYDVPDLPYYGSTPKEREKRSSYSIDQCLYSITGDLDYEFWRARTGLDELKYYQLAYPYNTMFRYTVDTPDSTTQFAPFIMKDGKALDIFVIEDNGKPIYFSWTEQPKAYSFAISDTMMHRIALRISDRAILLDSLWFEKGKKTILSVDFDHLPPKEMNVKELLLNNYSWERKYIKNGSFTSTEREAYSRYISRFPLAKADTYTYLTQNGIMHLLYHPSLSASRRNSSSVLVGPIPQGKSSFMDGVVYRHEGGYTYEFEDNVVYKIPQDQLPLTLQSKSDNRFKLNDFYLSPEVIDMKLKEIDEQGRRWYPSNIYISRNDMEMVFHLPVKADASGVSGVLFRSCEDKDIVTSRKDGYKGSSGHMISGINPGTYDVILLYNSGRYIIRDSITFKPYTYTMVDLSGCILHDADDQSEDWLYLQRYQDYPTTSVTYPEKNVILISKFVDDDPTLDRFGTNGKRSSGNIITGTVYDSNGEPIIFATIAVKGTTIATTTDIDGKFVLDIGESSATIVVNFIGFVSKELKVEAGSILSITLEEEEMLLEEMVVVGYGVSSLEGRVAGLSTSSWSDTPEPKPKPESDDFDGDGEETVEDAEDILYQELMLINGLRSNFSDVGFWQPSLVTNRDGEAEFTVTFPDNITKWNAVVYAMNRRLQTGTLRKYINSYKPLMAELRSPQFLVEGDRSCFVGNIRNYTKDKEIAGSIFFAQGSDTLMSKDIEFTSSHQDKMFVVAPSTDSITSTYLFTRNDGYSDGEKRSIGVIPKGTEIANGTLQFLRNGDKIDLVASDNEEIHVSITGKQLDIYLDAADYLAGYRYACNEQLASKLIGLLNYKLYREYEGKPFRHDRRVAAIIRRLVDNRNENKLWSWWGRSSETSFWMSAHIMRALKMAEDAGYRVNLKMDKLAEDYVDLESYRGFYMRDIELLSAVSEWGAEQNYKPVIEMFEKQIAVLDAKADSTALADKRPRYQSYLKEKLLLWELRQLQNIDYSSDSIVKYLKQDVLGNVYCDDGIERYWYSDQLQTTLIAYRIARCDSTLMHYMEGMQSYILGTKQYYWNTYQASTVVGTVFPDLLKEAFSKDNPAAVQLSGKDNKDLSQFPYNTTLTPGEHLNIEKKSGMPLIYSSYTMKYVTEANIGDAFEVSTYIENGDTLRMGEIATLVTEVNVKQKNAEHVLIEIPIPAGCSYASKPNYNYYNREVHREYFKEKMVVFCENLPEGTYRFTVSLLPRYVGTYSLNPAKVEMMYFPVINANNDLRKVDINESR